MGQIDRGRLNEERNEVKKIQNRTDIESEGRRRGE